MSKPDQIYTTYIKTTPEKLWAAITNPEFARQYWGGNGCVSDWTKGSGWQLVSAGEKGEVRVTGKVVDIIPPTLLVLTWVDPDDTQEASRVSFDIEPFEGMVCLTVTHSAFKEDSSMPAKVAWGWPRVVSSLKSYLETGEGLDVWAESPCRLAEAVH